jgi:hypothetical protein
MNDKAFLKWLYERLVHIHQEDPYTDYMTKFASIINAYPNDKLTPNTSASLVCSHTQEPYVEK